MGKGAKLAGAFAFAAAAATGCAGLLATAGLAGAAFTAMAATSVSAAAGVFAGSFEGTGETRVGRAVLVGAACPASIAGAAFDSGKARVVAGNADDAAGLTGAGMGAGVGAALTGSAFAGSAFAGSALAGAGLGGVWVGSGLTASGWSGRGEAPVAASAGGGDCAHREPANIITATPDIAMPRIERLDFI
ncbi:hypothetical protein [Lysobacter sp. 22409]|uniref:hypothetical protein n=1 Tax=Lysobacter sp. 22409 TaxID=3453917 RepID=UPI003F86628F